MVEAFINDISKNGKAPIPFVEIVAVTRAAFKVIESLKTGGQQIDI